MTEDVGVRVQRAAEEHLAACMDAFWNHEEGDETLESPASAPFCGCDTCIVREVLFAAWPILEEHWLGRPSAGRELRLLEGGPPSPS